MKRFTMALVLVLLTIGRSSFAQDAHLGAVAPYVGESTIAIVRVDLSKVDLAGSLKATAAFLPEAVRNEEELKQITGKGEAVKKALQDNGVSEVFAVCNSIDLRNPSESFFVVLPVAKGKEPQKVIDAVSEIEGPPGDDLLVDGNAIILGPPGFKDRVKSTRPAARPDLAKALAAAKGTSIQLAAALPADMRRVVAETLDKLPKEIGGGSGRDLADGLQWLSIGIDAPPKTTVILTLQAKDNHSAQQVRTSLKAGVAMVLANEEIVGQFPPLKTVVPLLVPDVKGDKLILELTEENGKAKKLLDELIKPAVASAQEAAARMQSMNNLKQILLSMHMYHDTYRHFPARYGMKKDGTKLLSWRVYLLPYLEQNALYEEFHLEEPWDSEHNKKLIEKMPKLFASPALPPELAKKGMTTYVGPVGEKTIFEGDEGTSLFKILDGSSNTIAVLECDAEHAVIWTKPDDLAIDFKAPLKGLKGVWKTGTGSVILAGICDGSIRAISDKVDAGLFRKLLQKDDGEVIEEIP